MRVEGLSYQRRLGWASPATWVLGMLLFQFIFWLIAFPEQPTLIDGEPREHSFFALFSLSLIFMWLAIGLFAGYHGGRNIVTKRCIDLKAAKNVGVFLHCVSFIAMFVQLFPIISNPASVAHILEPAGINKQAYELRESSFGIATLVVLWMPAFAIYLMVINSGRFHKVKIYAIFLLLSVCVYGVMMMSRTHIITAILMVVGFSIVFGNRHFNLRNCLTIFILIVFVIWINSLIRTGILYSSQNNLPLFGADVQYYLLQEFVEKYLSGEFNSSLIISTYDSDPLRNFVYGSMFSEFSNTYRPDRYIYTLNILGYSYWQFGLVGAQLFVLFWGWALAFVSRVGVNSALCGVNFYTLMYLISFPGFFQISRINYFFLHYAIIPFIVFSLMNVFMSYSKCAK